LVPLSFSRFIVPSSEVTPMLKRALTFLGNLFGWLIISIILGAFIYFTTIIIMLFAGLPLMNFFSEDLIDPVMNWWMSKGPYTCFVIAFVITIIVENNSPLFFLKRDPTLPKETDHPNDRA